MKYVGAVILVLAYIATVPLANYMIGHVGTVCVPNGPCLISVAPGIMAPSGVVMIGIALLLRDLVQRNYGKLLSIACIVVGAAASFFIAPPALAIASASAFLVSEFIDFSVYTPLQRNHFILALLASVLAGAIVDSALFLFMAFGSLDHLLGQVIGKLYAVVAFVVLRWILFGNQQRREITSSTN